MKRKRGMEGNTWNGGSEDEEDRERKKEGEESLNEGKAWRSE